MKIQEKILEFVFKSSKPVDVWEIERGTRLSYTQIHSAIFHLKNRGLITSKQVKRENVGYKVAPIEKILISPRINGIKKIKWVLNKAKNGG